MTPVGSILPAMAGSGPTDPDPPPDPDQIITFIEDGAAWRNNTLIGDEGQALYLMVGANNTWVTTKDDGEHKLSYDSFMKLAGAVPISGSNAFRVGPTTYTLISQVREGERWAVPSPT